MNPTLIAVMPARSSPSVHPVKMATRFRGFLPVIVDVETGGFDHRRDALLEVAAVLVDFDDAGLLQRTGTVARHVLPFEGANLDPKALAFNGIKDPWHPFRFAVSEHEAVSEVFRAIRQAVKENECTRAILVGHNPILDLNFVNAAATRAGIKRNPFHAFSCFDTATLAGVAYGQTVLARAVRSAGLEWDETAAHSAVYDAERTADLFCAIVNRWGQV